MTQEVFFTVPRSQLKAQPELRRYKILAMLEDNANEIFTSYEIAKYCDYEMKNYSRHIRYAITELIVIDEEPIVSTNKGFMYTHEIKNIDGACESLNARKEGLTRKIIALQKVKERLIKEQMGFPMEDS